jgi:hypothetical protein
MRQNCVFISHGIYGIKKNTGIGPVLAQTICRYKIPLSYPDYVKVGARVPLTDGLIKKINKIEN